ncbi:UbiA family prenyltransferase [Glycomyces harbinensis]|uniref:Chlorophyll synthase n=1 Tax=Glycomyces harbinensis TaxID=58114 RepID=A0A1G7BFC7_9ACTN|nr:UbiA family prenyltransferase [Glycomyces harbinensis]SDE25440.1 chlorophyll synthase [Glycomyces harbinensis]
MTSPRLQTPPAVRLDRADPRRRALDVLAVSRPRFWIASIVMAEIGFVLATHRIVPRGQEVVTMAHLLLVSGPLLWLAVLAVNDAHDLATDRINPRKAGSPLVAGRISARGAFRIAVAAGVLTVLAAIPLGALFTVGCALVVLLGWAYSAPPIRLKARPGADLLANAVIGVVGPLGGWVAFTGGAQGFPWPIAVVGVLAAAGLYLPTTAADRDADRAAGIGTIAVSLGPRAVFELGFALWTASAVLAFLLSLNGIVLDASLVPLQLVATPVLLVMYRRLLRDRPSFTAITVVACAYVVPCAGFALTYIDAL